MATQLLTVPETGQRLGVHKQSVYRLIWAGQLAVVNVGNGKRRPRLRIKESSIEDYIRRNEIPGRFA